MNTKADFSNPSWKALNRLKAAQPIIIRKIGLVAFLVAGMGLSPSAQAFANLDFESASVTSPGPGQVPFSSALPGWTGYCGTNIQAMVNYNTAYLDTAGISLFNSNSMEWKACFTVVTVPVYIPGTLPGCTLPG
jgi:hypothetical protein